jgi:hypothetical protein
MNTPLNQLFEDSKKCCVIAGQATELSEYSKRKQHGYIQSEVDELLEAIDKEDLVEQLDACNDILVTVFGFMQKLERQGANLEKSMLKTGSNNLTKFPTDRQTAEDTVEYYRSKGKETTISFNPVYKQYVIRDINGKYLKPKGFIENNLSDCFPENNQQRRKGDFNE